MFSTAMIDQEASFKNLMSVLDAAIANPTAEAQKNVNDALINFGLARHKTMEEFDREFMSDSPIVL